MIVFAISTTVSTSFAQPEERMGKMAELNELRMKKYTEALKDEVLAKKVMEYEAEQMKKRMEQQKAKEGGR